MSNLRKYYRKPHAFVNLPSKGKMYNLGETEESMMEEIGVLRMTMMNQLSTNNPETLINGQTVEELIRDCTTITSIEPRHMFKCDIDALIMGIRMVSVEDVMNIELACPKCEEKNLYGVDLGSMLADATYHEDMPYDFKIPSSPEIILKLIPTTLDASLKVDQTFFQDAKEIEHIRRTIRASTANTEYTEEEMERLQSEMKAHVEQIHNIQRNMTINTMNLYAECVLYAQTPDEEVHDKAEIFDFIVSLTPDDHDALKERISEINKIGIPKDQAFKCPTCEHEYRAPVEINPTDFFGNGSR